ncbi:TetR/AcrR family transcriptional regulator [Georgenia sp. Z1344]|uniref:TetR/AcrR family transcriptional regulator n=1 Tax=Georgenia sp. Z1344 TaxID=3416706 RepID=UPI003CF2A343
MANDETATPGRRTRAEQREDTRRHLVLSALANFTSDGYHGASLEKIAADAGYSKGAVYSNFAGKAELFLAVMDHNIAFADDAGWDPMTYPGRHGLEDPPSPYDGVEEHDPDEPTPAEAAQAFGLATLEFIGATARDPAMREAIGERIGVLVRTYSGYVADRRPVGEDLTAEEVSLLLTALDQGTAVLSLGGVEVDPALLRVGLHRLMDPAAAAATGREGAAAGDDAPTWSSIEKVRELIEQVRAEDQELRGRRDATDGTGNGNGHGDDDNGDERSG